MKLAQLIVVGLLFVVQANGVEAKRKPASTNLGRRFYMSCPNDRGGSPPLHLPAPKSISMSVTIAYGKQQVEVDSLWLRSDSTSDPNSAAEQTAKYELSSDGIDQINQGGTPHC